MNLNHLDLNKLAVFAKVVEAGSYRLASERLNVTPSALSQTISSLEHSLGFPLFHRLGKRLVLTESGHKIQREFQKYHTGFTEALLQITENKNNVTGLITIGAYLEFAKTQLASVIAKFQTQYTNVQIKLVFDTPSRLHRLLELGKLDIGFSIFPAQQNSTLNSTPIYRQELVLAAPKNLLSAEPTYSEVLNAPLIEYYFNHQPLRRWLMIHYKKKPRVLPIRTYASTAEMVLALLQTGLGAGVVPAYLLESVDVKSKLTVCRPTKREFIDHIWMLTPKGPSRSKAQDALIALLNENFQ